MYIDVTVMVSTFHLYKNMERLQALKTRLENTERMKMAALRRNQNQAPLVRPSWGRSLARTSRIGNEGRRAAARAVRRVNITTYYNTKLSGIRYDIQHYKTQIAREQNRLNRLARRGVF